MKFIRKLPFHIILLIFYVILGVAFVSSLIHEIIFNMSIFEHHCGIDFHIYLHTKSLFEISKVIGFSTFILGWIYQSLNKSVLGLTYLDLLNYKHKLYKTFSTIHILALLACMYASYAVLTESAYISFIILFVSLIYQWCLLLNFVINKRKCAEIAIYTWHSMCKNKSNLKPTNNNAKKRNRKDILTIEHVKVLAETLPKTSAEYYSKHIHCFVYTLFTCVETDNSVSLKCIAQIWEHLYKNIDDLEEQTILLDIMRELLKHDDNRNPQFEKKTIIKILSGYIVFYMSFIKRTSHQQKANDEFLDFARKIRVIKANIFEQRKDLCDVIFRKIFIILGILIWIYFQLGEVDLSQELLKIIPSNPVLEMNEISETDNAKLIGNVVDIVFDEIDTERRKLFLEIAKIQIAK